MMVLRVSISLFYLSILPFFAAQGGKYDVNLDIYNVGQGQCSVLRCKHKETGKEEAMLVDIGSTSYSKEFTYQGEQPPTPQKKVKSRKEKGEKKEKKEGPRRSLVTPSDFEGSVKEQDKRWVQEKVKNFITQLRLKFLKKEGPQQATPKEGQKVKRKPTKRGVRKEAQEGNPPIYVKTVVISHPDIDHYSWLTRLFCEKKDHIDYLILGGVPEHYDASGKKGFREWIDIRIENGIRVYFPTIQFEPIISMRTVYDKSQKCQRKKRGYMPCIYANPFNTQQYLLKKDKPFEFTGEKEDHLSQAFNFGDEVRVFALIFNPTHYKDDGEIFRSSESKDDNSDSLVIKSQYGESSALLTGDATGHTMSRVQHRYRHFPGFLRVNVYSASHHGSASHDSNDKRLIKEDIQPEYVLISNGHLHDHPAKRAYKNFKQSPRLKTVQQHKVLIGPSEKWKEGSVHITERAIFSTLNSGNLFVTLLDEKLPGRELIELSTEKHGSIEVSNKEATLDEIEEVESTIDGKDSVKVITKPKRIAKRTKRNQTQQSKEEPESSTQKKEDPLQ